MKPFKTLDEQIEILEIRGLNIEDKNKAKNYLLEYSYYNVINVYSKFFQFEENKYIDSASFNEIRSVHLFDQEIKSVLFKYLIECEKHFKSIISYRFSEYYKDIPFAYLQTNNYSSNDLLRLATTISILSKVISSEIRSKNQNAIKHYYHKHNDVPLWVLNNKLTFGQVVNMYTHFDSKLKNNIAKDIAKYLSDNIGTKVILEPKELENILFNLVELRNCVAHNNHLFGYTCKNHIKYIKEVHEPLFITKNDPRQNVFNNILAMQILLTKEQYALLHNTILKRSRTLNNKLHSISADAILSKLGFPIGWLSNAEKIKQIS